MWWLNSCFYEVKNQNAFKPYPDVLTGQRFDLWNVSFLRSFGRTHDNKTFPAELQVHVISSRLISTAWVVFLSEYYMLSPAEGGSALCQLYICEGQTRPAQQNKSTTSRTHVESRCSGGVCQQRPAETGRFSCEARSCSGDLELREEKPGQNTLLPSRAAPESSCSEILNLFEDFITDFQGPFILSLHLSTFLIFCPNLRSSVNFLLSPPQSWGPEVVVPSCPHPEDQPPWGDPSHALLIHIFIGVLSPSSVLTNYFNVQFKVTVN